MDARILVVDYEPEIADLVEVYLKSEGCTVFKCGTGTEALAVVREQPLDLAILDVMLPDISGLTLCGEIRKEHHFPVLMLTAKADDMDKLLGFEHGADDYLTKPFNILELKARIRALLRRSGGKKEEKSPRLICENITLDTDTRNAYNDGVLTDLTAKEFDLIELLMRNPNRVYSREALLDAIWGYDAYRSDIRTVDVHIRRLREKLERDPGHPRYIQTVWGAGYRFRVQ